LVGYLPIMKTMKFILSLFALVFTTTLFAQIDSTVAEPIDSNFVIVHKDYRIDLLVKRQADANDNGSYKVGKRTDKGFRLMIISTNNREEAIAAKTKVYTYFPELKAYLWYQSPYFRVKAGNFEDRKDAEAYQRRLNTYFPRGVFVMKDVIEVKASKDRDNDDR
jgi:hypothetical protein